MATRACGREPDLSVHEALARLPAEYRRVLESKYLRRLTMKEIAEADGSSIEAIESLLRRAISLSTEQRFTPKAVSTSTVRRSGLSGRCNNSVGPVLQDGSAADRPAEKGRLLTSSDRAE